MTQRLLRTWRHNKCGATFMSTRFRCVSAGDVASLLKSTDVWNPAMVVRKKVETIHLRVSATSKACLEGLANVMGKTSTRVLEELIAEAAEKCVVEGIDATIDVNLYSDGEWTLQKALQLAHIPEEPILKKLRTYFLADEALSRKDCILLEAILWSPDVFSGDTDIFLESERIFKNPVMEHPHDVRAFKIDLDEINRQMSSLEEFAEFRLKNKSVSPSYVEYLRMKEAKPKS